MEGLLEETSGDESVRSAGEDGEDAVPLPLALDDDAPVLSDSFREQGVVANESGLH
jgi:hypothetical protein